MHSPNPDPVLSKAEMYPRLLAGEFGNTLPRWFNIDAWAADPLARITPESLWGVQHTTVAGFPGTRLDCTFPAVYKLVRDVFLGRDYVISPMVHQFGHVQWEGDVARDETTGRVYCSGTQYPQPGSWRTHMKSPGLWQGVSALTLLQQVLNANSHDDLMLLLDLYPGHVVELTALDVCYGTHPHRNAVVWEVRKY